MIGLKTTPQKRCRIFNVDAEIIFIEMVAPDDLLTTPATCWFITTIEEIYRVSHE